MEEERSVDEEEMEDGQYDSERWSGNVCLKSGGLCFDHTAGRKETRRRNHNRR